MTHKQQQSIESFSCSISLSHAALGFLPLQVMMGISSASQGKPFQKWAPADRALWQDRFQKLMNHRFSVSIRYLASEGAFFVRPQRENPYFVDLLPKAVVYAMPLLKRSSRESWGESVEARIYVRNLPQLGWCFTTVLRWTDGDLFKAEEEFKVVCDIPLAATQDLSEKMRAEMVQQGFEVESHEDFDGHKDEFGDYVYYPSILSYKMNGVEISV